MANILVIGPHPDDQELGMGGTIALLAGQGHDLLLLDATDGEPTPFGDPETRATEARLAADILAGDRGIIRRRLLGLPNRRAQHSLEARHRMAGVIRAHQAQIVFVPHPEDAHPDHRAITRIVEDARFDAKLTGVPMPGDEGRSPIYAKWLFYYYATHLRTVPRPTFILDISAHLDRKLEAILAYRSQFVVNQANRPVVDWVRAQAVYFGSRIGAGAGEPFFSPEPPGLASLDGLVL